MYVAAESYKFVRLYPLGIRDLPIKQSIIRFEPEDMEQQQQQDEEENEQQRSMLAGTPENGSAVGSGQASPGTKNTRGRQETATTTRLEDAVDFTPPDLISALITENGVLTPSAVSEELIKLWF